MDLKDLDELEEKEIKKFGFIILIHKLYKMT